MSKFDDEWNARIEDVKDRMAFRLKEYGFEVDESHIYTERVGDRLDNVDVDIVGEFTGMDKFCLTFASGSAIAACLKDYPYKDVVTFIHNITKITVDTGRINAIEIFGTPMEDPTPCMHGADWTSMRCLRETKKKRKLGNSLIPMSLLFLKS